MAWKYQLGEGTLAEGLRDAEQEVRNIKEMLAKHRLLENGQMRASKRYRS